MLQELSKQTDTRMEGLDYRLKERDSIYRKLSHEGIYLEPNDILRYTNVSKLDDYVNNIGTFIEKFNELGYNVVEIDNKWLDYKKPYNGVHLGVKTPSGYLFELQFHTPNSLDIKEPLHKLYEKHRVSNDEVEKAKLTNQMREIAKGYIVPKNINDVKNRKD